jgi:adenylate cyclase
MAKILVADDEADLELLIKQKFRKQIRENQYDFVFALNGKQALEMIEKDPEIELLLTDINMPEMDGITLLGKLGEASPLIKSVVVSAYGDMENIRSAMNRGAFDFVCKPVDFADLEVTMEKTLEQVRQTKETLKALRENNILRMYVDSSVLDFMNSPGFEQAVVLNENIEATVMFVDICSFTSLTETQPVNEVIGLLNRYFDMMVMEIIAQDGHVDKFMGDAVMAVFRGNFHLDRAIESALAIRRQIEKLNSDDNSLHFRPHVSIGINSGELVSGNIGSASLKRLDYTVIGDVVNTAQRLQSAAKPAQILISEATYEKVKQSFSCEKVGEVSLKNKANPVVVYEVRE